MFDLPDFTHGKLDSSKPRTRVYAVLGDVIETVTKTVSNVRKMFISMAKAKGTNPSLHTGHHAKCEHCNGSGSFGDYGMCFQYQGKGFQSDRDRYFNLKYRAA